jgi:hypothetical protein
VAVVTLRVAVIAPGAVVMVEVAVVMAMVMAVAAVVMAVAAVVVAGAQVVSALVMTVVGSEKNKYFSFVSHNNGPNRVRDSYKRLSLSTSLKNLFKTCLDVDPSMFGCRSFHREA